MVIAINEMVASFVYFILRSSLLGGGGGGKAPPYRYFKTQLSFFPP